MASARLDGAAVTFRFPDPGYRLAGVRLSQDVRIPGDLLDFHRTAADVSNRTVADVSNGTAADAGDGTAADAGDGWELTVARPPVTRMEYLFELRYPDGGAETVTDPGNPRQAQGAFGPKSVLEFPSYRPPRWLTAHAEPGRGLRERPTSRARPTTSGSWRGTSGRGPAGSSIRGCWPA